MPVATQTFSARYGGDLVEIVQGEWACDGHELVRRFPDRFGLDSLTGRTGRGNHGSSKSATRGVVPGGRSRVAGLPEMRHAAKHTVAVNEWAYRAINMEIGSGLETGGVLLGTRDPDGTFLVSQASGPGGSLMSSYAIRHDVDHYARFEASYAGTGIRAFGIYHEHPEGTREPSETDLRSWAAAAEMADDGTFLGVIVGDPEHPAATRMWIRAWTVTGGVCEPATVIDLRND